jgi:hypothetical protein
MNNTVECTDITDNTSRIIYQQGSIWKVIYEDSKADRKKKICAKPINEFINADPQQIMTKICNY